MKKPFTTLQPSAGAVARRFVVALFALAFCSAAAVPARAWDERTTITPTRDLET